MKTIILKSYGVGRYDDVSPYIITDNKLTVKVELPAENGEFYFIAENNGVQFKKLVPIDGKLIFDGLTAGEFAAEIKQYLKGEHIRTYKVESLLLKEVDGALSAEPQIAAMIADYGKFKEQVKEQNEAITKHCGEFERATNESIAALGKIMDRLMNFAEFCIKAIPYISNYKLSEDLKND